ncbi:MAG: DUF1759 domain-containing protein [Gammaproteobacteria bacterium]|nr:DUF1759 domain-containing protein [Gammaproteobacteria bacterium]
MLDFSGDLLQWKPFWDSFVSQIHSRDDLSDVDKFHYLRCLVKGRALTVIEGIPITGENYRVASQLLQERYASTRVVIESLYKEIVRIPQCGIKTMDLQTTYDSIEKLLRQLETLHENLDHSTLITQVKEKFPVFIRQKIEEIHNSDVAWSMAELRQCLYSVIQIRRRAVSESATSPKSTDGMVGQRLIENKTKAPQNVVFQVQEQRVPTGPGNRDRMKIVCIFCGDCHYNDACAKYRTADERMKRLSELQCCFFCFKKGHTSQHCQFKGSSNAKPCFHCKKSNHNRALCKQKYNASTAPKVQTKKEKGQQTPVHLISEQEVHSQGSDEETEGSPTTTVATMVKPEREKSSGQAGSTVQVDIDMLLTATAVLENPQDPGKRKEVRVLLDCCSEKSYIVESAAQELKLSVDAPKKMKILTFGAEEASPKKVKCVRATLRLQDGSPLPVKLQTVQRICGKLRRPAVPSEDLEMLKKQESTLSDKLPHTNEWYQAEFLLGLNVFMKLLPKEMVKDLPSGLTTFSTRLGVLI